MTSNSDNNFFRITQGSDDESVKRVSRRDSFRDTSDQWNYGGFFSKRSFYPQTKRLVFIFFVIGGLFSVLTGRLFQLQIVEGADFRARSEGNRVRTQIMAAPRGNIFDSHGVPLVKNEPIFYVAFVAADLPNGDELDEQLTTLSTISGIEKNILEETINSVSGISFRAVTLIDDMSYDDIIALKTRLANWSGLEVGMRGLRVYPYAEYTSHILGYLGKITAADLEANTYPEDEYVLTDYVGKSGIEQYYESVLKGIHGKRSVEINVRGQVQKVLHDQPSIAGADISLAVDIEIQKKLYDLLSEKINELSLSKGAAIAINPKNGAIIAAVSLPSYDNNIFSRQIDQATYDQIINNESRPLFFRPLQGEYPSGSTFKPVVALAALINNIVTPETTFFSSGGLRVDKWFFPDWQAGGHGTTDIIKALAESVNTYFYYIGGGYDSFVGLGVDAIVAYAKELSFTRQLGVDYPSEGDGFLPSRAWKEEYKGERWYIGDTYNISIGQGDVLVTPLQTTAMMAFLANGGKLYKPTFIKSITYADGTTEYVEPEIMHSDVINQQSIAVVRQGLKATGDWGSARSLNALDPFEVAGKTGTAQVGGDKEPHAWFTSFAPFDDPEIALTILIENGETSNHAVAVARDFYTWYKEYITE